MQETLKTISIMTFNILSIKVLIIMALSLMTLSLMTQSPTTFNVLTPIFVERKACYSALFTNLVGWHAGGVRFPPSDVILAQLACPLYDVMFCLHLGLTNLSLYKHWLTLSVANERNFTGVVSSENIRLGRKMFNSYKR